MTISPSKNVELTSDVKALMVNVHPKDDPSWDPRITEYGQTSVRYDSMVFALRSRLDEREIIVQLCWKNRPVAVVCYHAQDLDQITINGLEGRVVFKLS